LVPEVEKNVVKFMPKKIAVQFDGWSDGTTHYMATIGCFNLDDEYQEVLLGIEPLPDETSLCEKQHAEGLKWQLEVHGKKVEDVLALIGDHHSVNGRMSKDLKIPAVGCAAHRFNLAINYWLERKPEYEDVIERVHVVMTKLRTLKNAAKLHDLTDLCAIKYNKTRWSSKHDMLVRYLRIESKIKQIKEVEDLALYGTKKTDLLDLVDHFKNFNNITKNLQIQKPSLDVIRKVFDTVVNDYPIMKEHLGKKQTISRALFLRMQ